MTCLFADADPNSTRACLLDRGLDDPTGLCVDVFVTLGFVCATNGVLKPGCDVILARFELDPLLLEVGDSKDLEIFGLYCFVHGGDPMKLGLLGSLGSTDGDTAGGTVIKSACKSRASCF